MSFRIFLDSLYLLMEEFVLKWCVNDEGFQSSSGVTGIPLSGTVFLSHVLAVWRRTAFFENVSKQIGNDKASTF